MIDKAHLRDKEVVFRLVDSDRIYRGFVRNVESDGVWIETPHLIGEMQQDRGWGPVVGPIQTPILFVPTSSLLYLIASEE
jgi:hypothetical protein